ARPARRPRRGPGTGARPRPSASAPRPPRRGASRTGSRSLDASPHDRPPGRARQPVARAPLHLIHGGAVRTVVLDDVRASAGVLEVLGALVPEDIVAIGVAELADELGAAVAVEIERAEQPDGIAALVAVQETGLVAARKHTGPDRAVVVGRGAVDLDR